MKDKKSEVWDPEAKGAEDYQGGHKLIIKQALLGPEAVEGWYIFRYLRTLMIASSVAWVKPNITLHLGIFHGFLLIFA